MFHNGSLFVLNTGVHFMRFQVVTAASLKMTDFWDIALCSLIGVDRRFRGAYLLRHQATPTGRRRSISQKALILFWYTF
jgi:hypothetical protein